MAETGTTFSEQDEKKQGFFRSDVVSGFATGLFSIGLDARPLKNSAP